MSDEKNQPESVVLPGHSATPGRPRTGLRVLISLLAIPLVLVVGFGGAYSLIRTSPKAKAEPRPQPTFAVHGTRIEPRTVIEPITGYGTARPLRATVVSAEAAGSVTMVDSALEIGAAVDAGHVLVRLDSREYEAQLARFSSLRDADEATRRQLATEAESTTQMVEAARAESEVARREYERLKSLMESGASNPRELDLARAVFEQARRGLLSLEMQERVIPDRIKALDASIRLRSAEMDIAKLNIERCTIAAPFGGSVNRVNVDLGSSVAPGAPLFELLDLQHIEIPIELPASLMSRVAHGAACTLSLETQRDVQWTGTVARLAPQADASTRTSSVFVVIDNAEQATPLLPGTFVNARVDGPMLRDVLIVPRAAIQSGVLFVERGGSARRAPVQVHRQLDSECAVTGIEPGAVVLTTNLDVLFDGAPITVQVDEPRVAGQPDATESSRTARSPHATTPRTP